MGKIIVKYWSDKVLNKIKININYLWKETILISLKNIFKDGSNGAMSDRLSLKFIWVQGFFEVTVSRKLE